MGLMKGATSRRSVRVLALGVVAACLSSCEGPRASSWHELFEVRPAVSLTEEGIAELMHYTNELDVYSPPGALGLVSVASLRAGNPESVGARRDGSSGFARTTAFGRALARSVTFYPSHILDTPYWTGRMRQVGAMGGERIFVATNWVYPIFIYSSDGLLVESVGQPPPSWRQARRPALGEFPPSRRTEWHDYLRAITVISALAVMSDSVLVVTHGRIEPDEETNRAALDRHTTTHADVYLSGRLLAVDLPARGELAAYSNTSLFFLERAEGSPGGQVSEYVWRPR